MRIKLAEFLRNGPPPRLNAKASTPGEEDCNSNTSLVDSQSSLHDAAAEFDSNDYQWFLDYNPLIREGSCHHPSVLSSISAAYKGVGDLSYQFPSRYDALSRDIDANLAEADMDTFRTQDIHSLLMTANLNRDTVSHDDVANDGDESNAGSINTISLCKSELLFSPVKEPPSTHGGGVHFSVDSLDCDLLNEQELIITCQANKNNYTIAFEGSLHEYSDNEIEPVVNENCDKKEVNKNVCDRLARNLELLDKCNEKMSTSMARSYVGLTTWSKLRKQNCHPPLKRHPSGNNNEPLEFLDQHDKQMVSSTECGSVIKSQSLPNIYRNRRIFNSSVSSNAMSNSTVDSYTTHQKLADISACIKAFNQNTENSSKPEPMSTSSDPQSSTEKSQKHFNLVKLFMKQKSLSNEGIMSNTVDMIDRSECWLNSSECESYSSENDPRKAEKAIMMNISEDDPISERDYSEPTDSSGVKHITTSIDARPMFPEDAIANANRIYDVVYEEEEQPVDKNIYATISKPWRNINNINLKTPIRMKNLKRSTNSSATSISSCSDSDPTQLPKTQQKNLRATSTQVQVKTCDASIQTSVISHLPVTNDKDFKVMEYSFLDKLKEVDCEKPVYVLYPNYTLPDLSFIRTRPNVHLKPVSPTLKQVPKNINEPKGKRPFSCNDIEVLKKKGLGHIKDWDSLSFLLPIECRQLLSEVPEIMHHFKDSRGKEKYSPGNGQGKLRPVSADYNTTVVTNVSSSSSTATQPSSGYRGSSTILNDDSAQNSPAPGNINPLFVYRYESTSSEASSCMNEKKGYPTVPKRTISLDQQRLGGKVEVNPPRPPLPRSILRKSIDKPRKNGNGKRYSMFEMDECLENNVCRNFSIDEKTKRRSLQEIKIDPKKNNDIAAKMLSKQFLDAADKDAEYNYYRDEGVGTESSLDSGKSHDCKSKPKLEMKKNIEFDGYPLPSSLISSAELEELEEFLKQCGVSCQDMDEWDPLHLEKVRCEVSKFLTLKRSIDGEVDGSKGVGLSPDGVTTAKLMKHVAELRKSLQSCKKAHRPYQFTSTLTKRLRFNNNVKNLAEMPICEESETLHEEYSSSPSKDYKYKFEIDVPQKQTLVSSVTDAVEMLIQHFSPAKDRKELNILGNSESSPSVAKLALNALCPALYAILRDGLKDNIETSFGAVDNSVWQMVEATARQGPITESLNELVLRINSEDVITEGLIKFNAFILGLLNSQSVDTWIQYIRTRESVLKKHYHNDSLMYNGCVGETNCKRLLDTLLACLEPLKLLPFNIDLMFEVKELHRSFKKIESDMRAASRPTSFAPTLTINQRNLLKLVRSIQSSCVSSDDQNSQNSVIVRNKEPSTPDLLNNSREKKITSEKSRPRSCINPSFASLLNECPNNSRIGDDLTEGSRRWSGVQLGSKLMQAFDRLALYDDSDDYTDSLEKERRSSAQVEVKGSLNSETWSRPASSPSSSSNGGCGGGGGGKFKKLQLKWEMLSNGDTHPNTPTGELVSPVTAKTSRIPRPVTSPVRSNAVVSPTKHNRSIPVSTTRKTLSPTGRAQIATPVKRQLVTRTSRIERATPSYNSRPSSLPQSRPLRQVTHVPRAASHETQRQTPSASNVQRNKHRTVTTLWHRLPTDSGHLPFNEGERLRMILEVDDRYLLCCRGEQKGLVPRNAVIFDKRQS